MAEKKAFPELRTYIYAGRGVSLGPVLLRHVVQHLDTQAAEIERLRTALTEIHGRFIHGSRQLYTAPDSTLDLIRATAVGERMQLAQRANATPEQVAGSPAAVDEYDAAKRGER